MHRLIILALAHDRAPALFWAVPAETAGAHGSKIVKVGQSGRFESLQRRKGQNDPRSQEGYIGLSRPVLRPFEPEVEKSKAAATIKTIAITSQGDGHYILLLASTNSNCNIQGICGAAEDLTLIWIKLDRILNFNEKKVVVINDCRNFVRLIDPAGEWPEQTMRPEKGKLKVVFGDDREEEAGSVSRLTYDTSFPDKGLIMTPEKAVSPEP